MNVLLIGGTGFLGGHAARTLIEAGHEVAVLSRGTHPSVTGAESLVADRRDAGALAAVLEGRRFDATVDFAAYDAADVERLLLVPYAALGRYTLISSGQVYLVTQSEHLPYREEDSRGALRPEPSVGSPDHVQWSYGAGKRRAEGALLALRASHGVRAVILRLTSILGAGDTSLRLWAWIERMLDGGPILLPDGGRRPTRFLEVGDVSRVLVKLIEGARAREAAYNLSGPEVLPLRDVLARVAEVAAVAPRFVEASAEDLAMADLDPSAFPYAGRWLSLLDPARAAAEWGFLGTRVEDFLPDVVRGYLEHRPERSHSGYTQREGEIELAARLQAMV